MVDIPVSSLPVSPGPAPAPEPVPALEPVPEPAAVPLDGRVAALEIFAQFVTERILGSSAATEIAALVAALEGK